MKRTVLVLAGLCVAVTTAYAEEPDAAAGARAFRACAACHSLEHNRNMTGPSLAGVANRKAGTLPSFTRYSDALKQSGVSWNEESLDHYLENPAQFIPGNHMTFPGIPDPQTRANIIAFLKQNGATDSKAAENGMAGGMGGMGQRPVPNLKTVAAECAGEGNRLLPRHVQGDDAGRQLARILGAQPALQNGLKRRRSSQGRARHRGGGDDGRPRLRDLLVPR
jgi:cytochrome c